MNPLNRLSTVETEIESLLNEFDDLNNLLSLYFTRYSHLPSSLYRKFLEIFEPFVVLVQTYDNLRKTCSWYTMVEERRAGLRRLVVRLRTLRVKAYRLLADCENCLGYQ